MCFYLEKNIVLYLVYSSLCFCLRIILKVRENILLLLELVYISLCVFV